MTPAQTAGYRAAADKKRGSRLYPLKVTDHAHPLVRQLTELMNKEGVTLDDVARRSGIHRGVIHKWRYRSNPNIAAFEAVANVLEYDLKLVRKPRRERDATVAEKD